MVRIAKTFLSGACRWSVLGDSITHDGAYHRLLELFYLTRHPTRPVEVVNAGISGDTAAEALHRVNWDCLEAKPDVVSLLFGMNDIDRSLYDPCASGIDLETVRTQRMEAFETSMRQLVRTIISAGSQVLLIKPSPYDDTAELPEPNCPGLGLALARLGERLEVIAEDFGADLVDFNTPLVALNTLQQACDPGFSVVGDDRIHPGPLGHMLMAYYFLEAQNASGCVSHMEIDVLSRVPIVLENCDIQELMVTGNLLAFTFMGKALPFPVDDTYRAALAYVPFTQNFNRETIQISGLAAGVYQLFIDGQSIRPISSLELANGVNLALESNTPQVRQAFNVQTLLKRKWDAVAHLRTIALCEHKAWPDSSHPVSNSLMGKKLDDWVRSVSGINYFVSLAQQYPALKRREEFWRQQAQVAQDLAWQSSQPKSQRFELHRVE